MMHKTQWASTIAHCIFSNLPFWVRPMDREQLRLPISRAIFYIFTKTALEILYDISIKTKNIQGVLSFSPIIKDTFMFFLPFAMNL